MTEHLLKIDLQKIAQEIKNTRHFLDRLEAAIEKAITDGKFVDQQKGEENESHP